jgi:hypothetical protein
VHQQWCGAPFAEIKRSKSAHVLAVTGAVLNVDVELKVT